MYNCTRKTVLIKEWYTNDENHKKVTKILKNLETHKKNHKSLGYNTKNSYNLILFHSVLRLDAIIVKNIHPQTLQIQNN